MHTFNISKQFEPINKIRTTLLKLTSVRSITRDNYISAFGGFTQRLLHSNLRANSLPQEFRSPLHCVAQLMPDSLQRRRLILGRRRSHERPDALLESLVDLQEPLQIHRSRRHVLIPEALEFVEQRFGRADEQAVVRELRCSPHPLAPFASLVCVIFL